jgi:DNA-binding GntR family transcriptional regulator
MSRRRQPPASDSSDSIDRTRLTLEAYETLKAEISSGTLQPRERLYETILAERFKMSRTPIREALQRLVNEGLAEAGPGGACVAALSVKDIRSLEQANRALQSLAAELATSEGSEGDMAKLEELMGRMEACAGTDDTDGWITADQAIHRHLFQMSGNRWLLKLLLQMEALVSRVRHIGLRGTGRMKEATREHRTIIDAIKSRDPEAARRAMHDHLVLVEQHLVQILETFVVPLRGDGL